MVMIDVALAILMNTPKTITDLAIGFTFEHVPETTRMDKKMDILCQIYSAIRDGFINELYNLMDHLGFTFIGSIRIPMLLDTTSAIASADAIRPKFCTDPRANPLDEVRRRILDWIYQWNWAHRWSTDSPMITTAIDSEVSFADLKHPF